MPVGDSCNMQPGKVTPIKSSQTKANPKPSESKHPQSHTRRRGYSIMGVSLGNPRSRRCITGQEQGQGLQLIHIRGVRQMERGIPPIPSCHLAFMAQYYDYYCWVLCALYGNAFEIINAGNCSLSVMLMGKATTTNTNIGRVKYI